MPRRLFGALVRIVDRQLERHGPLYAVRRVEMHWTDRDALIAELQRDYSIDGSRIVAHDDFELHGMRITETWTVHPGWMTLRGKRGERLGVAEIATETLSNGYGPPPILRLTET